LFPAFSPEVFQLELACVVPTPTEFFRWWIVDERAGKRRLTRFAMTRAQAAERYADAEPDLRTREVRDLPEPGEVHGNSKPPESNDVTVALTGVQAMGEVGTVADQQRTKRGRYKGEPAIEVQTGHEFWRANDSRMVQKTRIIDRQFNRYTETVKDKATGEVVHHDDGSLKAHFGHGDAKVKKR
jgi:hypothetical protein